MRLGKKINLEGRKIRTRSENLLGNIKPGSFKLEKQKTNFGEKKSLGKSHSLLPQNKKKLFSNVKKFL